MAFTVAIADDEMMMIQGLTHMVPWNDLGYEVVVAVQSGRKLIDFVIEHPVDVVLTDVRMEDMSGIDVAQYLHEHMPETITVIISGYLDFGYAQQAIEHAVYKYLLKPVSVKDMCALMNDLRAEIVRRRHLSHSKNQYDHMQSQLLRRFAIDAARGVLRKEHILEERMRELSPKDDFFANRCVICSFILPMQGLEEDVAQQFEDIFTRLDLSLNCYVIYAEAGWVRALLVETVAGVLPAEEKWVQFAQELAHQFYCQTENGVWVYIEHGYDSIRSLCSVGFEKWNLPVISSARNSVTEREGSYSSNVTRHNILKALGRGDIQQMRADLQEYLEACADPVHGIWHARFMARVLLWQIAQQIDDGGESLVFVPDEYAIVRANSASELTDLVMSTTEDMLQQHDVDQRLKDPVERAKEYIAEHYAQDFSLFDLSSNVLHISPAYFSRMFHERTGTTCIDYLNSIRLNAAARLLRNSLESLSEVAEKVGFSDVKYFARRFKAHYHCTPSEYREREKGKRK